MIGYTSSAQLIINEVLYDPPAGAAGDANGDGTRDATEDGFIEFINNSATSLDVSGYMIYDYVIADDTRTLRHTIPDNTILPANGFLVVFGGGTPTGSFGGATVIADVGSAGLSMQNTGERIEIENASGTIILTFDSDALSNNPDESYSRDPDITGNFIQHSSITAAGGALFSPGTLNDGTTLSYNDISFTKFSIYPNPITQGKVYINSNIQGVKQLALFDVNGRQVIAQKTASNSIDVSQLTKGFYLLQVDFENRKQTTKLVIN